MGRGDPGNHKGIELWRRAESLFDRALKQPRPERQRFVRRVCGADHELLRAVGQLLEHDPVTDLGCPVGGASSRLPSPRPAGSRVGRRLGAYRLLRRIGRGGTASVYLARRADAEFEQQVAIKVLHRESVSEGALRRLRRERQILAALTHPNIARLLDGGTADDGTPFLVMEHVEGLPVTAYCDTARLTVKERLVLFRTLCDAVSCAHRSLIVHRDLKPANILVSDEGVPKLLDFGIAALLENATHTSAGLTPAYASPEQRTGGRVTTASDVYSLGVLLHELLAGCRPMHPNKQGSYRRPSESVRLTGEEARLRSSARATTPERLRRHLQDDLDSIVLRALRPEPGYRYSSVGRLAWDIGCYLHGLPVSAGPDTWRYRLGKWIGRNRLALICALVVGGLALTLGLRLADQRRLSLQAPARAESVAEALVALFETSDPHGAPDRPGTQRRTSVTTVLHGPEDPVTESTYHQALQNQGRIYGEDHLALGILHNKFGRWLLQERRFEEAIEQAAEAERIFLASLPGGHWLLAYARGLRGAALTGLEQYEEASALLEEAHRTLRRVHGDDSRFTREAREHLTDARRRR